MHIQNICTKDPTTCAFGTLAQNIPEMLIVMREQNALINGLLSGDDDGNDPDYDNLRELKQRSNQVTYNLIKWSKRLIKETAKCPQPPKH